MATDARPGTPQWWKAQHTSDGHRPPLSADSITKTALELIDADGLGAFNMRRLAEELGTAPASIYRHVESKEVLLLGVLDAMLAGTRGTDLAPAAATWQNQARDLCRRYREALLRHPRAVPLLVQGRLLGRNALAGRERGLYLFRQAGFSPILTVRAYLILVHYVAGFVLQEAGQHFRSDEDRKELRALFSSLPADTYPTIVDMADELADLDPDAEFEFGLTAMLTGIESHLRAEAKRTSKRARRP